MKKYVLLLLFFPLILFAQRDNFNRANTTDLNGSEKWVRVANQSNTSASVGVEDSQIYGYNPDSARSYGIVAWDSALSFLDENRIKIKLGQIPAYTDHANLFWFHFGKTLHKDQNLDTLGWVVKFVSNEIGSWKAICLYKQTAKDQGTSHIFTYVGDDVVLTPNPVEGDSLEFRVNADSIVVYFNGNRYLSATGGARSIGFWNFWMEMSVTEGATKFRWDDFSIQGILEGDLPIQLTSFRGKYLGYGQVELEWQTISEINNYGFQVQRLNKNSKSFETIGFVPGNGTTLEQQIYTFIDENPGDAYEYRLKQIDNNGLTNYLGPIKVNPNGINNNEMIPAKFALKQNYPNPFNPSTIINYQLASDNYVTLKLYNLLGEEVAILVDGYKEAGLHSVNFDGSKMMSGIYFYKLQSGNNVEVRKLTLVK
jgi:hypothetical protein